MHAPETVVSRRRGGAPPAVVPQMYLRPTAIRGAGVPGRFDASIDVTQLISLRENAISNDKCAHLFT
jgi:hypothetical protein